MFQRFQSEVLRLVDDQNRSASAGMLAIKEVLQALK